jgi:predicted TIM-barrel fold metal-dependent hydrolase
MALAIVARAQNAQPTLAAYVDSIRAIDNHAHVIAPDSEHDSGYDALPCDALPAGSALPPANTRFGPDVLAAWNALYGFSGTGADEKQLAAARGAQDKVRQQHGPRYFDWVLDRSRIDVALANRVVMASALKGARFLWVPYDDALLFPLDNETEKGVTPDRMVFYGREEQLLKDYLRQDGVGTPPGSLDQFLEFVARTLARQKNGGAVAIKFEAAYLRSLDFAPADRASAASVYGRSIAGTPPSRSDYKTLQDFIFRFIAAEAGRLGLVVHIHTGSGCGDFFDNDGANPMRLSSVLNDPELRRTVFVLLHGGSPTERTAAALIVKPNVYVDTSSLELLWSPAELARTLRPWLETMPEHVMFGTDAGPWGPGAGWEETTWLGSRKTRQALTLALTQMINEHVITSARAREIARRVLRDNATELYRLSIPGGIRDSRRD